VTVKVLIERWAKTGSEDAVWDLLRSMRAEAVRTRGYIYGETWRSLENPRVFMVLSVWASREHWNVWSESPFRKEQEERMASMLRRPPVVRLFQDAGEPLPAG
jgi:heme-degrading monooxygenase HmoA